MHSHNYTLRQLYGRRFVEGEADAFIAPSAKTGFTMLRRWASACAKDGAGGLRRGQPAGAASAVVRRTVFCWGWWRGNQLGSQRRRTGNADPRAGQAVVLARYEAATRGA